MMLVVGLSAICLGVSLVAGVLAVGLFLRVLITEAIRGID